MWAFVPQRWWYGRVNTIIHSMDQPSCFWPYGLCYCIWNAKYDKIIASPLLTLKVIFQLKADFATDFIINLRIDSAVIDFIIDSVIDFIIDFIVIDFIIDLWSILRSIYVSKHMHITWLSADCFVGVLYMLASMHNVHAYTHDTSSTACIRLHVVQVPVGKGTEVRSSLPNEENATACRRYMAITVANAVLHQIPKVLRLMAVFNHERYSCMHVMNTINLFHDNLFHWKNYEQFLYPWFSSGILL